MNFSGIIIGFISFLLIGLFHPIVVKAEYYFTDKIWPVFLILGLVACGSSFLVNNIILSSALAVLGCTLLWSIKELKEQTQRVNKGWFPKNPKRK